MQIENRQKLLIILAATAIGLFAGDRLVLTPLAKSWSARSARIAELRKDIANGNRLLLRSQNLRSRWDRMSHNTLSNNTSAAEQQVFKAIDRWAQEAGVIIASITPQWKHDSDEYMTYECRVDTTGDLSRLSRFLYSVESEPLALKLQSVELAARDKEGQQLSLGLQISGLVLNSQAK